MGRPVVHGLIADEDVSLDMPALRRWALRSLLALGAVYLGGLTRHTSLALYLAVLAAVIADGLRTLRAARREKDRAASRAAERSGDAIDDRPL